jgi:hypothetical protein
VGGGLDPGVVGVPTRGLRRSRCYENMNETMSPTRISTARTLVNARPLVSTLAANVVQIGDWTARRKQNETLEDLLSRALREYPDKRARIAFVGFRED